MSNVLSVTIGIPAHNEARNIEALLRSISRQIIDTNFILKKIIVACDACTDKTSAIVQKVSLDDSRISLIDDRQRLGQSGRLNHFYQTVAEDVFVTFDADTILANQQVLNHLLKPFMDKDVMLVGGNDTPNRPRNLIEKIGAVWVESWYAMRVNLNGGDTVHNHKGCVSAARTKFLKSVKIPTAIFSNDDFLYFSCRFKGFKFNFVKDAIVYYRIPSTFHDYMTQTTRFLGLKHRIAKHFGDQVYDYYRVPIKNKIMGLLSTLLHHPIIMPMAVVLQVYQRFAKKRYTESYSGVSWKIIKSSKQ